MAHVDRRLGGLVGQPQRRREGEHGTGAPRPVPGIAVADAGGGEPRPGPVEVEAVEQPAAVVTFVAREGEQEVRGAETGVAAAGRLLLGADEDAGGPHGLA